MNIRNKNLIIFLFVYIILFLVAICLGSFNHLTFVDVTIISIATFRAIRLIAYDSITKNLREYIFSWSKQEGDFFSVYKEMLMCPWCSGIWAALKMLILYSIFPPLVIVLAIAGIGSFIQITIMNIGWGAEVNKAKATKSQN